MKPIPIILAGALISALAAPAHVILLCAIIAATPAMATEPTSKEIRGLIREWRQLEHQCGALGIKASCDKLKIVEDDLVNTFGCAVTPQVRQLINCGKLNNYGS
jgi:hypothetical protein